MWLIKKIDWFGLLLLAALGGAAWWYWDWRDHSMDGVILAAARRYEVEPALVKAVAWRETWFSPSSRGKAGELGLMQIRPVTAGEWAKTERVPGFQPEHLLDARTNALVGAWCLRRALRRYPQADDPVPFALADYNAGRGRVLQWSKGAAATNSEAFLADMPFPGTKAYTKAVMRRERNYRDVFPPAPK
jgi:soluble lytic murein transglycosylase